MTQNEFFSSIEENFNKFLYGFSKEQLKVGITSGEIKLENLNIKLDIINEGIDEANFPFWLKAGLISKISICLSLMNAIGEKPVEVNIEGLNIMISPSLKWIFKNLESYIYEDLEEMKSEYIPYEINSFNIFSKKKNVSTIPVFTKEKFEQFFKDKAKISEILNIILMNCFEYYYSKNFPFKLKIKNMHIRYEDEHLINYMGNIALGIKFDTFELNLSSEATMKKNNFKITKFDIYWENNANILIPNSILYNSIKNSTLNDNYYTNLKKIKFQDYKYKKDTKFILHDFEFSCNFGTKAINKEKIDLFGKQENNYKIYFELISKEININLFPDFYLIINNFINSLKKFSLISQMQKYKPKKKPYNEKNKNFIELLKYMNSNENTSFSNKRKMIVRDWFLYFYWCYKYKKAIYNYSYNPLRTEFSRYFNLCAKGNNTEGNNGNKGIENDSSNYIKKVSNRDNINLSLKIDIKIKGLNLNLHPFISSNYNDRFICIKINNIDNNIFLNKDKFDLNFSVEKIILGPSKKTMGEKVDIVNNISKKKEMNFNIKYNNKTFRNNKINFSKYIKLDDCDSNMGLPGLLKKYNPYYHDYLNFIDKTMENINSNSKKDKHNLTGKNSTKKNNFFKKEDEQKSVEKKDKQSYYNPNYSSKKNINFSKEIIESYESNPYMQKLELNKQKNEFKISQVINHYNNNKLYQRNSNLNKIGQNSSKINSNLNSRMPKNQSNLEAIHTGEIIQLNLLEIFSNNKSPCFSFKYHKKNDNSTMDSIQILLGTIRVNLFPDYMIKCSNVLNEFENAKIKSSINDSSSLDDVSNINKKLYMMEKYFYKKLNKLPEDKKTEQIKRYMTYLKRKLEEYDTYKIDILLSIFSKGINININYDNLECIYYSNKNNEACGKAIIPSPAFNLLLNSSKISFKIFDFEFEINDLDNTKILIDTLSTILEDKLKMAQLLMKPSLIRIRNVLQRKEIENNNLKKIHKNNLNLNNIFNNSDEGNNLNTNTNNQEKEKDYQIISNDKSGIDILNNTHNNNININDIKIDNNIIYENNIQDKNNNEIIPKIETEIQENNEKSLLKNTIKEDNNKIVKKGKINNNFVTNKEYKIKERDKEIIKTAQKNGTNRKLNIIMRNNNFFNTKDISLNRYNNSYEIKDPNNKSINNKKNLNIGKDIVNKKNNINSKSIEIYYDNKDKEKAHNNIKQNKNEIAQFENKKENKFIKIKLNSSLKGRNKSKDNILLISKLSNKRIENDGVFSTSNLVNKDNTIRKKQILKRKLPLVVRENKTSNK